MDDKTKPKKRSIKGKYEKKLEAYLKKAVKEKGLTGFTPFWNNELRKRGEKIPSKEELCKELLDMLEATDCCDCEVLGKYCKANHETIL